MQATLGPFWSQERLSALTTALLQHFFVLGPRELEAWQEDAEAFYHSQDGMAWQDSLRPCAEHLYLTVLKVGGVVAILAVWKDDAAQPSLLVASKHFAGTTTCKTDTTTYESCF